MNSILIVGRYGILTRELINKFYKEDWRIFTLAGKEKTTKPDHVFEQYNFDYESSSIKEILDGCRPDVIVYTGAYDPAYNWEKNSAKETSLKYIADLSSLLISSNLTGVSHFIYLSSHDVFEDEQIRDIGEDVQPTPRTFKGLTVSQGESLILNFNETSQSDITVVRIANLYGIPKNRRDCQDSFTKMILKVLIDGRVQVNGKKIVSGIFIKDAVEGIYSLAKAPERKENLYHLSSMEGIGEDDILKLIQEGYTYPIEIADKTIGLTQKRILSNSRFSEEFNFSTKHNYKETIPRITTYMSRHRNLFLKEGEGNRGKLAANWFFKIFKKLFPFLENLIFFVLTFIISLWISGNPYFSDVNVYLLYVLLFSIVHGRQQAIFSSLLSTIGYFLMKSLGESGFSLLIDFNTYIWIAQIFIVGLTVGHLKDRFRVMEADKDDTINFITGRLEDINRINASNTRLKDFFSERVISSTESIGHIYDVTSRLDKAAPGEVLFAALDTISDITGGKDIAIYLVSNPDYCRLASASGEKATSLGKSLPIKEHMELFEPLLKRQVFINRELEEGLPMMAISLFDEKDEMRIVILIWSLSYDEMNLYHSNLLRVVSALIYSALVRDANYMEALTHNRYIDETIILQGVAFNEMVETYKRAEEKGYAEFSLFYIEKRGLSHKDIDSMLKPMLRSTDYIGDLPDGKIGILLINTNAEESQYVKNRFLGKGIETFSI